MSISNAVLIPSLLFTRILNFLVVEVTPIGIQNLKWKFYLIWLVLNAVIVPLVYLFYPETTQRTLEDMDEYYRGNPPLLACLDKEGIALKRPAKYQAKEEHIIRAKEEGETADHVETAEVAHKDIV